MQKGEIEAEIGQALVWDASADTALDKTIAVHREIDLRNRDQWPDATDWMVSMTEKMRRSFGPRVKRLSLEMPDAGAEPNG